MKQMKMLINAADRTAYIRPELYGHFSEHLGRCIYDGIYVGENSEIPNVRGIRKDVIDAFRQIRVPVLRWPGGCFADTYHWQDGIGVPAERKKTINAYWGGVTESNRFGTHEFFDLCELVGCAPYLAGNLGTGSPRELAEWLTYITSDGDCDLAQLRRRNGRSAPWKLKYLGIGNENWGCGGNMRPEYYADLYRQVQSFCMNFTGEKLFRIACGPCGGDYHWTEVLMQNLTSAHTDAISLHYYAVPEWEYKGSATVFSDDDYARSIRCAYAMDTLLRRHTEIMNRYDPENRIGLVVDEWGNWYDVEEGTNPGFLYQQNTMRDAVTAALTLNLFNRYAQRVVMANLAQAVNVLQALLLTDGAQILRTPTYHVFDLFQAHQGGESVYCFVQNETIFGDVPMVSSSASVRNGVLTLTLANCSPDTSAEISCDICNFDARTAAARVLTGDPNSHNTFEHPETVQIQEGTAELLRNVLHLTLPPCCVTEVTLRNADTV